MTKHQFTDKELMDHYRKQLLASESIKKQMNEALANWRTLINKRTEKAKPFVLINNRDKKAYRIVGFWADPDYPICVIRLDRGDRCWNANLDEFTVTKRKVKR